MKFKNIPGVHSEPADPARKIALDLFKAAAAHNDTKLLKHLMSTPPIAPAFEGRNTFSAAELSNPDYHSPKMEIDWAYEARLNKLIVASQMTE